VTLPLSYSRSTSLQAEVITRSSAIAILAVARHATALFSIQHLIAVQVQRWIGPTHSCLSRHQQRLDGFDQFVQR
jgi:hypothetical protein